MYICVLIVNELTSPLVYLLVHLNLLCSEELVNYRKEVLKKAKMAEATDEKNIKARSMKKPTASREGKEN